MIENILGGGNANLLLSSTCGCLCDCYPNPRGGDYNNGYLDGTGAGARDNC